MRARLVLVTVHAAAEFVVLRAAVMVRVALFVVRAGEPVTAAQLSAAVPPQCVVPDSTMVSVRLAATTDMKTRAVFPSRRERKRTRANTRHKVATSMPFSV